MIKRTFIFLLLVIPVFLLLAYAQWEDGGKAIRKETNLNWEGISVELSDGSSVVVWNDAATGLQVIKLQRFDSDGSIMWSADGMIVSEDSGRPHAYRLAADEEDNIFCSWKESSGGNLYRLCLQKVNILGELLWTEKSILIAGDYHFADQYSMISDNSGGMYIAWAGEQYQYQDIFLLHILANGDVAADWSENGLNLSDLAHYKNNPLLVNDGEGGVICGWRDMEDNDGIYLQRISEAGELLWGISGMRVTDPAADCPHFDLLLDSSGNIVICYRESVDSIKSVYAEYLDTAGNSLWSERLELYTGDISNRQQLVESETGEFMLGWNGYTFEGDTYTAIIQFDITGSLTWTEPYNFYIDSFVNGDKLIYKDFDGGAWISLRQFGVYSQNIVVQHLNAAGEPLLGDNGLLISNGIYREPVAVCHQGTDGILISWLDRHNGEQAVFVQKINAQGEIELAETGESRYSRPGGNTQNFKTTGSEDLTVIAWEDNRNYDDFQLYMQIVDNATGECLFEENGIAITQAESQGLDNMEIAYSEAENTVCVSWTQYCNQYLLQPFIQVIDLEGNLLCGETGMQLASLENWFMDDNSLQISDSGNGYNVVWKENEPCPVDEYTLFMQHITNGEPVWGDNGLIFEVSETVENPTFAKCLDEYVVWCDDTFPFLVYYVTRLTENGELAEGWTTAGVRLNETGSTARLFAAEETEDGLLGIWIDSDGNYQIDIYGQLVNDDGSFCWEEDGKKLVADQDYLEGVDMAVTEDYFYLTYFSFTGSDFTLKLEKFDFYGNPVWDETIDTFYGLQDTQQDNIKTNGEVISVYAEIIEDGYTNIYGKFYHTDGTLWEGIDDEGILITGALHCQKNMQLRSDGSSDYLVWEDERGQMYTESQDPSIYIQKFTLPVIVATDETDVVDFVDIANYPNPFTGNTQLSYNLPRSIEEAEIEIYNVKGQLVRKITANERGASWDCHDERGKSVGSGVYFYRLIGNGIESKTEKMILLR